MMQDKMFVRIIKNELMVRVLLEREEDALSKAHERPMDFVGKPMKGFVYVAPEGIKSKKNLDLWIDMGIEYVLKSPPKKKKASPKRKK